jgi:NAD(P)-dependent dehydrogenase (short-subunit alcohol dehydrogenase family)
MVLAFAHAGAEVMIVSRKIDVCEALARTVQAETGRQTLPYAAHVGHWDEIEALVDSAYERFGRVDILVNNAGMSPLYDSAETVSEKLFDAVCAVNMKGPFRLTALVGSRMKDAGGGSIINVSSTASVRPTPDALPYAAAKAGLNALTSGFAHLFGPSVRVNTIMAGPFHTDATESWDGVEFENMIQRYALGRGGRPEEIVGAALFLASSASSFVTGSTVVVDGGTP